MMRPSRHRKINSGIFRWITALRTVPRVLCCDGGVLRCKIFGWLMITDAIWVRGDTSVGVQLKRNECFTLLCKWFCRRSAHWNDHPGLINEIHTSWRSLYTGSAKLVELLVMNMNFLLRSLADSSERAYDPYQRGHAEMKESNASTFTDLKFKMKCDPRTLLESYSLSSQEKRGDGYLVFLFFVFWLDSSSPSWRARLRRLCCSCFRFILISREDASSK